jgi:hypothetical protein
MTVWRLIKKLERAAWARKYSDVLTARAELAHVFGPPPASELLDVRSGLQAQLLEERGLVLCTACQTMTHIPTGTVCAQCLAKIDVQRSTTPMFSSKVPTSSRAITHEDLKGFADQLVVRGPVYGLNPKAWADAITPHKLPPEITTPLTVDEVAKHYRDTRDAEPMCEHGVTAVTCYECSRSTLRRYRKHERPQSGGSCDCPGELDLGRGCTWSDLECRVRSFQNGRLSVRAWFRTMRAAEFQDATRWPFRASNHVIPVGPVVIVGTYEPWTLFDTQAIVDRETAPHYVRLPDLHWTGSERAAWRRLFDPFFDGTR